MNEEQTEPPNSCLSSFSKFFLHFLNLKVSEGGGCDLEINDQSARSFVRNKKKILLIGVEEVKKENYNDLIKLS